MNKKKNETPQEAVKRLLRFGYAVIHEDDVYITLERQKQFSVGWFLIWLFTTGIGALFYIIYYALMSNKKVTIVK